MDFPLLPLITVWWRVPHVSPLMLDIGTIDGAWHCWKQPIGWQIKQHMVCTCDTCVYIYIYTYVNICIYIYIYVCRCIHICIYIYTILQIHYIVISIDCTLIIWYIWYIHVRATRIGMIGKCPEGEWHFFSRSPGRSIWESDPAKSAELRKSFLISRNIQKSSVPISSNFILLWWILVYINLQNFIPQVYSRWQNN